jgi:hypothetical protein
MDKDLMALPALLGEVVVVVAVPTKLAVAVAAWGLICMVLGPVALVVD